MQIAELAAKGEVLLWRHALVAEEDHAIFGERTVDLVHLPVDEKMTISKNHIKHRRRLSAGHMTEQISIAKWLYSYACKVHYIWR